MLLGNFLLSRSNNNNNNNGTNAKATFNFSIKDSNKTNVSSFINNSYNTSIASLIKTHQKNSAHVNQVNTITVESIDAEEDLNVNIDVDQKINVEEDFLFDTKLCLQYSNKLIENIVDQFLGVFKSSIMINNSHEYSAATKSNLLNVLFNAGQPNKTIETIIQNNSQLEQSYNAMRESIIQSSNVVSAQINLTQAFERYLGQIKEIKITNISAKNTNMSIKVQQFLNFTSKILTKADAMQKIVAAFESTNTFTFSPEFEEISSNTTKNQIDHTDTQENISDVGNSMASMAMWIAILAAIIIIGVLVFKFLL